MKVCSLKVNREIKIPLYKQVYEKLLTMITDREWQPGELLPSERELSIMFDVDRLTVRRSLGMLAKEGLVKKTPGLGTQIIGTSSLINESTPSNNLVFLLPQIPRFSKNSNSGDRITEAFNSILFFSVEQECKKLGYNLVYTTIKDDEILAKVLENRGAAGVLFVSKINSKIIEEAYKLKIPSVVINNDSDFFPTIRADRERGTYEAITYLISQNHRRIAFINGVSSYITSRDSIRGYKQALSDADIDWKTQIIKEADWTFEGGFNAMKEIIEEHSELPTAVFGCNDMIAMGAMEAIKASGLSVPQDISVIGCDAVEQSEYCIPKLTTIRVNIPALAKVACQNLFMSIQTQEIQNIQIILPTELIIRDSTANLHQ